MSLMCKMNDKCRACEKPCIHEWMMMALALLMAAGVLGHWVFKWF